MDERGFGFPDAFRNNVLTGGSQKAAGLCRISENLH